MKKLVSLFQCWFDDHAWVYVAFRNKKNPKTNDFILKCDRCKKEF